MKKLQNKVKAFCEENSMLLSPELRMLDLISELGEFSKEILKSNNYGKEEIKSNEDLELELGDTFFSLIATANSLDIDMKSALEKVLVKYEKRLEKGSAGSEND